MEETVAKKDLAKKTVPRKEVVKKAVSLKKVHSETARQLQVFKDRVNKKQFGRKVRDAEVLAVAVSLLTEDHVRKLQEQTYSEKDRLQIVHTEFQRLHGKISLDDFIGKLLRGEVQNKQ